MDENNFQNNFTLNLAISYYLSDGFRVIMQTENNAQLVRKNRFSILSSKEETLHLEVNNKGHLTITDQNGNIRVVKKGQPIAR